MLRVQVSGQASSRWMPVSDCGRACELVGFGRYASITSRNQFPKLARTVQSTTATPFAKLAVAHAATVCGDVFVTVALADSLFFSAASGDAKNKVLIYLLLTMAPFAIVAPLLGPLLDRTRGGRRLVMVAIGALRAVVCLILANHIDDLGLYPLALSGMVLGKAQGITKSSLVPSVVDDDNELVRANSRLALMAILAGVIGAPFAALILKVLGGEWVLRVGAAVFVAAAFLALAIPRSQTQPKAETAKDRASLHLPSIASAGNAMGFVRGVVGFMTFFGAFVLKVEDRSPVIFGFMIGASAVGNGIGTLIAAPLRRRVREEWLLVGAIVVPAVLMVFAARFYGVPALLAAAAMIAASAACARLAFDSILQRDAHEAVRGRAIARFETHFQLVWVGGGVVAVALPLGHYLSGRVGLFLVAIVMLFAGFAYLGSVRRWEGEMPVDANADIADDVLSDEVIARPQL